MTPASVSAGMHLSAKDHPNAGLSLEYIESGRFHVLYVRSGTAYYEGSHLMAYFQPEHFPRLREDCQKIIDYLDQFKPPTELEKAVETCLR